MSRFLVVSLFALALLLPLGQASAATKALRGKIAVDGAAVYAQPNFDSEVIDYLNFGVQVPASRKVYSGAGGLGVFHKVRTPSGKLGYMTDTDVGLPKDVRGEEMKEQKKSHEAKEPKKKTPPKRRHFEDEDPETQDESIYLNRYMGATFSMIDYAEKFSGHKLHHQTPFLGFRMSGPGALFDGPPIDFNVAFYPGVPQYVGAFAKGRASGLMLIGDLGLLLPFYDIGNSLVYYGLGVMWTFSNYNVQVGQTNYGSKEIRIGLDADLGYGYRFKKKYLLRADLKYYIEKEMYLSEMLSFQVPY